MPNSLIESALLVLTSVAASTGFWGFIQKKTDKKDANTELLIGLAHDRIIHIGKSYVDRGWISYDEYEDFCHYLYDPYQKFGGNGLAERIMCDIRELPVRRVHQGTERKAQSGAGQLHPGEGSE